MTAILIESETPFDSDDGKGTKRLLFENDDEESFVRKGTVAEARVAIRLGKSIWRNLFMYINVNFVKGFLRKVFGILAAQLVVTTIIGAAFVYTPGLKGVVQQW